MEKEFELAILNGTGVPSIDREYAFVRAADAAHAIAEWMRKAVAWEGPGKIGEYGTVILISPVSGETYGAFSPWPPGRLEETPIGQRVRVTVTKVG